MDYNLLKGLNRFIPIVPIDHTPTPPRVFERLQVAYRIITYSKFGHDQLQNEGLHSTYIPCSTETDIFKPLPDKNECKKQIGIPENKFVFGMVAANKDNPPRKSFQEAMDAFVMFKKKVPDSVMYFHTFIAQPGGFPIDEYAKFLGIEKDIFYLQPYDLMMKVDENKLNTIYNAMDCLLAPSTNEGFGIPIIEAQSAGVPVITNNWTSMPELIREGTTGYTCKVAYKRYSPMLAYIGIPDVNSIYDAMMSVYKKDRVKMGAEARRFILEKHDAEKVFKENWLPFLNRVEKSQSIKIIHVLCNKLKKGGKLTMSMLDFDQLISYYHNQNIKLDDVIVYTKNLECFIHKAEILSMFHKNNAFNIDGIKYDDIYTIYTII
jgi:glycosyltransferase involved in cell wall biosynthesis